MKKREIEHVFLIVVAVISIAFLINFIGAKYTGFYSLENSVVFDNNSNYVSNNINFSDSEIKLISYTQTENTTTETNEEYYIGKAKYDKDDVSSLIKTYDNNYLTIDGILEFELENNKKFISDQILVIYLDGEESNLTLCKAPGLCKNNHTNIMQNIHFTNPGFYNVTINLADEKKKLYLEGNISIDYIYMIEKNITEELIEKIYFKEQGSIETENINVLGDFNYFDADFILNNQTIEFYYKENGTWTLLNVGNITFNPERLMVILKSDKTNTPVLNNFILSYAMPCEENWTCSNWTDCINNTKIRICNDNNLCGTEINKPEETELCNETINQTNSTEIPSAPGSGGGGGGGSSGGTKPAETRTLETTTEKMQEKTRVLEKQTDKCKNGIKDHDENGIDCGGPCPECKSIKTILPYTNFMLFILLLMTIMTLIDKGRSYFKDEDSNS